MSLFALGGFGCGTSDSNSTEARADKTAVSTQRQDTVSTNNDQEFTQIYRAESADLGRLLFNENGFALYRFFGDEGSTPSCYGDCAKQWPPYLAAGEFRARKLKVLHHMGRTKRKDGTVQVTYFGHPLYTYVGDKETGDTNGNAVHAYGARWYALHPNGHKAQEGVSR